MNRNIPEKLHKYRGKSCQQPYSHRLRGVYKKERRKPSLPPLHPVYLNLLYDYIYKDTALKCKSQAFQ